MYSPFNSQGKIKQSREFREVENAINNPRRKRLPSYYDAAPLEIQNESPKRRYGLCKADLNEGDWQLLSSILKKPVDVLQYTFDTTPRRWHGKLKEIHAASRDKGPSPKQLRDAFKVVAMGKGWTNESNTSKRFLEKQGYKARPILSAAIYVPIENTVEEDLDW